MISCNCYLEKDLLRIRTRSWWQTLSRKWIWRFFRNNSYLQLIARSWMLSAIVVKSFDHIKSWRWIFKLITKFVLQIHAQLSLITKSFITIKPKKKVSVMKYHSKGDDLLCLFQANLIWNDASSAYATPSAKHLCGTALTDTEVVLLFHEEKLEGWIFLFFWFHTSSPQLIFLPKRIRPRKTGHFLTAIVQQLITLNAE